MPRNPAPIFADIDGMDPDKFVAHLSEDVVFQFGNNEPAQGRGAVKAALEAFYPMIDGMTHHVRYLFEEGDVVVAQIDVEYVRKDGKHVTVPNADILTFDGDLVKDWRIFIDLAPVFA
jgi:ketosteroid isomerase-like protein